MVNFLTWSKKDFFFEIKPPLPLIKTLYEFQNSLFLDTSGGLLKVRRSRKKICCPGFFKKRMLGQFYVLKITPAFVSWKNPGHHNLFLRFTDL